MWNFLETNFDINDLVEYQKFCDFNERGLIQSNDLSKYSSFNEILSVTSIAELKSQEKELEKQAKEEEVARKKREKELEKQAKEAQIEAKKREKEVKILSSI